jgi:hypothetical protein
VYPAGTQMVIYNTEQKTQKLVPVCLEDERTTCISTHAESGALAVGNSFADTSKSAVIHIFDLRTLRKRKSLFVPESSAQVSVISYNSGIYLG